MRHLAFGIPAVGWTCLRATVRPQASIFSPLTLLPSQSRWKSSIKSNLKEKRKKLESKKRQKTSNSYVQYDLRTADQFSLCDAMRYLRAFEVGRPPTSSKYEMHVHLATAKNGPVVRNRLRLPHPVKAALRICVICPPDSKIAEAARAQGALLTGEDEIFAAIKEGKIDFDRCICHVDSLAQLQKAALGRILGPKGLMPSAKLGTVVKDVAASVRDMVGASEYRERVGVVRMAIGQLGFTPEQMQKNIRAFMESVKKDIGGMTDKISKEVHEVGFKPKLTSMTKGLEFDKWTGLHIEWGFQKSYVGPNK